MSKQKHTILVAALGGHQVSMTNPRIGTVLVSRRGWAMFRLPSDRRRTRRHHR